MEQAGDPMAELDVNDEDSIQILMNVLGLMCDNQNREIQVDYLKLTFPSFFTFIMSDMF